MPLLETWEKISDRNNKFNEIVDQYKQENSVLVIYAVSRYIVCKVINLLLRFVIVSFVIVAILAFKGFTVSLFLSFLDLLVNTHTPNGVINAVIITIKMSLLSLHTILNPSLIPLSA